MARPVGVNRLIDKDYGYKALLVELARIDKKKPQVVVGIRQEAGSYPENEDGEIFTVAEVALFNEFGTETAPPRPFLRSTIDRNRNVYTKELVRAIDNVLTGKDNLHGGLRRLGERVARDVKLTIRLLEEPPNAPYTIKKKGSSKPLIDTGRLRNSIDYEIREGGR